MGELEKLPSTGSPFLDRVRRQIQETWTPDYYKMKVEELLNAEDSFFDKNGTEHKKKNWKARKDGIDKMDRILFGTDKEIKDEPPKQKEIKITINVNGKVHSPPTIEAQVVADQPKEPQSETPQENNPPNS